MGIHESRYLHEQDSLGSFHKWLSITHHTCPLKICWTYLVSAPSWISSVTLHSFSFCKEQLERSSTCFQNHLFITSHQWAGAITDSRQPGFAGVWGKRTPLTACGNVLDTNMDTPQNTRNQSPIQPSNSTSGHLPKSPKVFPKRHLLSYIYCSIIHYS